MQLRSRGAAWVVVLAACGVAPARAQERATELAGSTHGSLYLDSDHTTIVTSSTNASARFDERWHVGAHYLLDVVSSASIDVVTQASVGFDDTRHDFGGQAGYRHDDGTSLIGSYSHSTEHDWQSHNAALSASIDALERNLSLGVSLALQDNTITRSDTFGFERKLQSYIANASATYSLTPRDLLHIALALSYNDGFQASPYRYLTVRQMGYAENVPEQRGRYALVGRYHRSLGPLTSLRTHARLYVDSYEVASITGGIELAYEHDALDLMAMARGYAQSHASFYRSTYDTQQRYMTIDKELSTFWDVFVGGSVGWSFRSATRSTLRIEARTLLNYFQFIDFVRLPSRYGLTATLGISAEL